ncbi:MAG: type II toxin-antitoxin system RelE/ParE family toxin [Melioribacteraceae bacterium]
MIISFGNKETERFYISGKSKKYQQTIIKTAIRKLDYLNAAKDVNDLKVPPGNRLEMLKGNYKNMYSIRINNQYRIIFSFSNSNATDVEIIDYQ